MEGVVGEEGQVVNVCVARKEVKKVRILMKVRELEEEIKRERALKRLTD